MTAIDAGAIVIVTPVRSEGYWSSVGRRLVRDPVAMFALALILLIVLAAIFAPYIAPADPFWWLTHERDAALTGRSMWMLRVVDAPAAIAARVFPAAVSVTVPLVISDHARPGNSGRWDLTVTDGSGILIPNEGGILPAAPALRLGARGLAALYAGTPVAALRLAGLASGGSPDTDAALDAAFAATAYMVDDF